MVTPAAERKAVAHLMERHRCGQNRPNGPKTSALMHRSSHLRRSQRQTCNFLSYQLARGRNHPVLAGIQLGHSSALGRRLIPLKIFVLTVPSNSISTMLGDIPTYGRRKCVIKVK